MAFDLKTKVTEIVDKIKNEPDIMDKFQKEPEKTIENIAGVDIPDGQLEKIIEGVKAKISIDKLSGVADKISGIFKK